MKTLRVAKTLLVLAFASFSSFSFAADQVYTIGVQDYEHYLPYSHYENEVYSGLGRDILDLFAKKKGYVFKYEAYPIKRLNWLYLGGKVDFRFPDNPYWVANQKKGLDIKYAPLLKFADGVLVSPKNLGKGVGGLKRLGMPLGYTPYAYLDLVKEGKITLYENPSYLGLYDQVWSGKIDGAYANIRVAKYYWRKIKGVEALPVVYDPGLPHVSDFHHIGSFKHKDIIDEIDAFMKDESNKAAIEELKRSYKFDPND